MILPFRGQPARQRPYVLFTLLGVNFLVFLWQWQAGEQAALRLFWQGGAIPARLAEIRFCSSWQSLQWLATVVTSQFLHAGWLHLGGNLLMLWVFGEALEEDLGHWRFLGFYFFCGFFALLFHTLMVSRLRVPIIGASGAIAGLMGAYLLRFPQAPVQSLVFLVVRLTTVQIPAFVWLGAWLLLQFYGLRQGGTVAWWAHVGGFLAGFLGLHLFLPAEKPRSGRMAGRRRPRRQR